MAGDKRKQSVYFSDSMLKEIQQEAARLDRSLSWVMQRAWKIARAEIHRIPSANDSESREIIPAEPSEVLWVR